MILYKYKLIVLSLMLNICITQVFYENFDDGLWNDTWTLSGDFDVVFAEGANSTEYSIRLLGTQSWNGYSLVSSFGSLQQPNYISFYTMPTSSSVNSRDASNYFVLYDNPGVPLFDARYIIFFYHKEEYNSFALNGNEYFYNLN